MRIASSLVAALASSLAMSPAWGEKTVVEVTLEATKASVEIGNGGSIVDMKTFNGVVPGPTIEANKGDILKVTFTNNMDDPTTLHWHGVEVPALMDGTPISQNLIEPGETFVYEFPLLHASTHWYHTHMNAYMQMAQGLYGALVIHDSDQNDQLPAKENDWVFILDDILLEQDTPTQFVPFLDQLPAVVRVEHLLNGRYGSQLLVNNNLVPMGVDVQEGTAYRLRLINVANARFMRISIPNAKVWHIGGDGGLFENPVEILPIDTLVDADTGADYSNPDLSLGLLLTPGERAELVFEATGTDPIVLEWHGIPLGFHDVSEVVDSETNETKISANHANPIDGLRLKQVMVEFTVSPTGTAGGDYEPPPGPALEALEAENNDAPLDVTFGHGGAAPDGSVFFYGHVDSEGTKLPFELITPEIAYALEVGKTYLMDVANADGYDHNFHLHGFFFQPVSTITILKSGEIASEVPAPYVQWKDTIHLPRRPEAGGKTVQRVAVHIGRGDDYPDETNRVCASGKDFDPDIPMSGGWLMHCHMLEHADFGMQSFYQVTGCVDEEISTDSPSPDEPVDSESEEDSDDAAPSTMSTLFLGFSALFLALFY